MSLDFTLSVGICRNHRCSGQQDGTSHCLQHAATYENDPELYLWDLVFNEHILSLTDQCCRESR